MWWGAEYKNGTNELRNSKVSNLELRHSGYGLVRLTYR